MLALVAADPVLAFASGLAAVAMRGVLWGLHMGLTQGLRATLVADTAPTELRGTAFGVFNLVGGIAMLLASVIAGALWDAIGAEATFLGGRRCRALWPAPAPRAVRDRCDASPEVLNSGRSIALIMPGSAVQVRSPLPSETSRSRRPSGRLTDAPAPQACLG